MDCPSCKVQYNDGDNCPRLLISCGHSICQKCLSENFCQGAIVCQECKALNRGSDFNSFPRNLALLNVKAKPTKPEPENISIMESTVEICKNPNKACHKHNKKVEAFCENDRQLLCITCILEDGYKDHQISSIKNASEKERRMMDKAYELSKIIEGKLKHLQCDLPDLYKDLKDAADKCRGQISTFFNDVRKVIADREAQLKQKLSDLYRKEETKLKNYEENLEKHIDSITKFYEEFDKSAQEEEIGLLRSSADRNLVVAKATANIYAPDFKIPFEEFNKENELSQLWKLLNPGQQNKNKDSNLTVAKLLNKQSYAKKTKESARQAYTPSTVSKNTARKEAMMVAQSLNNFPYNMSYKQQIERATKEKEKLAVRDDYDYSYSRRPNKRLSSPQRSIPTSHRAGNNYEKDFKDTCDEKILETEPACIDLTPYQHNAKPSKVQATPKRTISLDESQINKSVSSTPRNQKKKAGGVIELKKINSYPVNTSLQFSEKGASKNINALLHKSTKEVSEKPSVSHSQSFQTNEELLNFMGSGPDDNNTSISSISIIERNNKSMISESTYRRTERSMYQDYRSELTELTPNKMDLSLLCQNVDSNVYILGGFVEGSLMAVERFDVNRSKWDIVSSFKNNRSKFSSVALPDNNILLMGGKLDGIRTSNCEVFSTKTMTLQASQIRLTGDKSGFGALCLGDDIYACGGNDGNNILRSMEKYSLKSKKWSNLAPMKYKRDEMAITIGLDKKIYAIGGFGGPNNTCLSSVERFNPSKNEWESIAPLNIQRRALAAVTLPDGIYAIGGFDGENYLSSVERYDEVNNEWILIGSMNYPRCTLSAVSSADFQHIYVFGGFDNGPLNTVEKYSILNDKWETIAPMNFKRFMHTSVMIQKTSSKHGQS